MEKKNILEIISESSDLFSKDSNNYIYENVPSAKLINAKQYHKLDLYEEILFLRDFTFFGSATESFVITVKGLSFVNDDTKDPYKISWDEIEDVDYIDDSYVFFFDNNKNEFKKLKRKDISHDSDDLDHIGKTISISFKRISNEFENKEKNSFELIQELKKNNDLNGVIEKTEEFLKDYNDTSRYLKKIQFLRAEAFYLLNDFDKALALINNVLERDPSRFYLRVLKGKIQFKKNEYYPALNSYQIAYNLKEDGLEKDNLKQVIDDTYSNLISNFFDNDYSKRKTILVSNGSNFLATAFLPLDKNKLPNEINFPVGHPIENELYIGHPFKSIVYLPLENYELDLFLDRINEFCYLLQCLGAVELSIKTIKGQATDKISSEELSVNSSLNIPKYGAINTEFENKNSNESNTEFNRKLEKIQRFSPTKKPFIPTDLIWFNNEPSWQRLYQQRINGNILEYHENVSTNQKKLLSETEFTKIKAEYEHSLVSAKIDVSANSSSKFTDHENTEWEISVKFESIENLID